MVCAECADSRYPSPAPRPLCTSPGRSMVPHAAWRQHLACAPRLAAQRCVWLQPMRQPSRGSQPRVVQLRSIVRRQGALVASCGPARPMRPSRRPWSCRAGSAAVRARLRSRQPMPDSHGKLSAHSGSASNSEKYSRCNGITQNNGLLAGPESQSAGLHRRPQDTSVACREVFQELICFVRPPENTAGMDTMLN